MSALFDRLGFSVRCWWVIGFMLIIGKSQDGIWPVDEIGTKDQRPGFIPILLFIFIGYSSLNK
ncbi:hypothetical protein RhiirC2_805535 [Rhizophagus irregularis]|uniref:Uncharacterized protein n=1 Tax=Rhizophagus irregularis TaxID=588596 RepID=A0A2N1KS25_9GLOM|nr:hypothetical protein RhiirC2_805535 [Rhizophagus irregularis]